MRRNITYHTLMTTQHLNSFMTLLIFGYGPENTLICCIYLFGRDKYHNMQVGVRRQLSGAGSFSFHHVNPEDQTQLSPTCLFNHQVVLLDQSQHPSS